MAFKTDCSGALSPSKNSEFTIIPSPENASDVTSNFVLSFGLTTVFIERLYFFAKSLFVLNQSIHQLVVW